MPKVENRLGGRNQARDGTGINSQAFQKRVKRNPRGNQALAVEDNLFLNSPRFFAGGRRLLTDLSLRGIANVIGRAHAGGANGHQNAPKQYFAELAHIPQSPYSERYRG